MTGRSEYILVTPNEDGGARLAFLHGSVLAEFLRDPKEYAGVTNFQTAPWFGGNMDDVDMWPEGTGVLLRAEVIQPVPAGAYVLPTSEDT
jgi:hypothetical protein